MNQAAKRQDVNTKPGAPSRDPRTKRAKKGADTVDDARADASDGDPTTPPGTRQEAHPEAPQEAPQEAPLGNTKATKEDWLAAARAILVDDGVDAVKILTIGARLNVSRSSFYWYFESRQQLLGALLDEWAAQNTAKIAEACARPAPAIGAAVCNFFLCFVDPAEFDQGLDFAVREWSRRDADLRRRVDDADRQRLGAVTAMFTRYGYDPAEADARARILYFMQLGYHALDVREPIAERMGRIDAYLSGFTGRAPTPTDSAALRAFMAEQRRADPTSC